MALNNMLSRLVLASCVGLPLSAIAQQVAPTTQGCGKAAEVFAKTTQALVSTGDRKAARAGYRQAVTLEPSCSPAWFNLGLLAETDHDWAAASDGLKEYLALDPHGLHAPRARDELKVIGRYLALPASQREAAVRKDDYDADVQRGRMFLASGLYKEAISEAARAQLLDESRWESYALVSLCMAKQHKRDEAVKFQTLAVNHAPTEKRGQVQDALTRQFTEWNP